MPFQIDLMCIAPPAKCRVEECGIEYCDDDDSDDSDEEKEYAEPDIVGDIKKRIINCEHVKTRPPMTDNMDHPFNRIDHEGSAKLIDEYMSKYFDLTNSKN
eukprot:190053_1